MISGSSRIKIYASSTSASSVLSLDLKDSICVLNLLIKLDLAKSKLIKKEQDVLHSAVDAYTNLILAREKQNINRKNLNLLRRQVENDKIRRDRGQITNTDLAQSESSLAGAQAQFTQAKSDLLIAKLTYENIIGKISDPNQLKKNSKSIVNIPNSLSDAINLSKQNNPDIKYTNHAWCAREMRGVRAIPYKQTRKLNYNIHAFCAQ